jgi:exonuclease SbcC
MRFHRIDISNINSLYGDNPIDIDGKFPDVPLYLIMGPTGSGKTTILDAVCLALFGTTPRQTDASGGAAGVGAQLNSRGTGTSKASVVFSLLDVEQGERTRYKAVWAFRRAYEKPNGTPMTPRRELYRMKADGEWSEIITSDKEKEYQKYFDEILDEMTLDDFLRSVMLAQGEFSALLKASADEKATILERLTDTGDYQKLGWLAQRRWREERDKLGRLDEKVENFDGASPEEIEVADGRLEQKKRDCDELEGWRDAAKSRRQWLERHGNLEDELAVAKKSQKGAQTDKEKHTDAFARRDADREASVAQEPLKEVRRLDGELESLAEKLPKLDEACTEKSEALETARTTEEKAKQELDAAEKAFEELKPQIDEAKSVKADLKNICQQKEELANKVEVKNKAFEEAETDVTKTAETLSEAKASQESAAERLAAIADDAGLDATIAGLQAEIDALQKTDEHVERASTKLDELQKDIEAKASRGKQLDEKLEAKQAKLEPLEEAVENAQAKLAELLGDAGKPRERYEELNDRRSAVNELRELINGYHDKREQHVELAEKHEAEKAKVAEAAEALEDVDKERADIKADIEKLDARTTALDQNLLAAELRRTLQEDMACPVCGGQEHPRIDHYGTEALDAQETSDKEARTRLENERATLRDTLDELSKRADAREKQKAKLSDTVTRLDANLESADVALKRLGGDIDQAADHAGKAGEPLVNFTPDADDTDVLEAVAATLLDELEAIEHTKNALNAAEDKLSDAQSAIEEAKEDTQKLEEQQKDLERLLENARNNEKTTKVELASAVDEADKAREALREKFNDAGIEVPLIDGANDKPNFEEALEQARKRFQKYTTLKETLDDAGEARSEAKQAHANAETKRDNAKKNLEAANADLEKALERATALKKELDGKLDGKDPDEVEERHQQTIKAARSDKEAKSKKRQDVEKAAQKAKDDRERAQKQHTELGEERQTAQKKLEEAIAGIESISTVKELDAVLLEADERERLKELCGGIDTALRDAARDIKRVTGELTDHNEKKPEDFEPDHYEVETLQAAERQLDEAVGTYNQQIGSLKTEIEQMRDKLADFRDMLEQRDKQQDEYDGWNELYSLIGVRGGEHFKQFAQALNLDSIVERANHRLKELYPRYRLKTQTDDESGLPTLNFEVIDQYHADKPRSLSTLSGGETFLVSLALALALADQQKIKMPIETLFLDEGFGTLDRSSLSNAVSILDDLHTRAGRTVGVISHVEALQESITSQIIVKPEQDGRSSVALEQR